MFPMICLCIVVAASSDAWKAGDVHVLPRRQTLLTTSEELERIVQFRVPDFEPRDRSNREVAARRLANLASFPAAAQQIADSQARLDTRAALASVYDSGAVIIRPDQNGFSMWCNVDPTSPDAIWTTLRDPMYRRITWGDWMSVSGDFPTYIISDPAGTAMRNSRDKIKTPLTVPSGCVLRHGYFDHQAPGRTKRLYVRHTLATRDECINVGREPKTALTARNAPAVFQIDVVLSNLLEFTADRLVHDVVEVRQRPFSGQAYLGSIFWAGMFGKVERYLGSMDFARISHGSMDFR